MINGRYDIGANIFFGITKPKNIAEHDLALEMFEKARNEDPFRVEQLHLYSDSLFVRVSLFSFFLTGSDVCLITYFLSNAILFKRNYFLMVAAFIA